MFKISFITLLSCVVCLTLKAQVPKRTSDPAPAPTVVKASIPMKSGGGDAIHTTARVLAPLQTSSGGSGATGQSTARAMAPLRSGDGGSGGSSGTGKTLAGQVPAVTGSGQQGATSKPVFHSDVAAGQDSVQKH